MMQSPSSPLKPLPIDVNDTVVRVFGSVQAQTQSTLIFDPLLRKELFAHGVEFRWVCEVMFDGRAGTDAFLLTPENAALTALGKLSRTFEDQKVNGVDERKTSDGLVLVGSLCSDWCDADGTEDPVKWVQRTATNPGGSLTRPPHSMPIAFGSEHPAARIAKAAARGLDAASRAYRNRQQMAEEAGVDISELDGAAGGSPSHSSTSRPYSSIGVTPLCVEPALRCPLQLRTYIQMRIPRTSNNASLSGGTKRVPKIAEQLYAAEHDYDPFGSSSPLATLPHSTTFVPCTTDLAIRPLVIKTQLTKRDVLVGIRDVLRQDGGYLAASKHQEEEQRTAVAGIDAVASNPYAVDEGPLDGDDSAIVGNGYAQKRESLASRGGETKRGSGPRAGTDACLIDYDALDLTSEDADSVAGYNNIRVTFADLSIAVLPIVGIHPDATTVTSSTALLPATSSTDRDRIADECLRKDLLRCQFLDIKSIVPAKVLEWSQAPRTISYGCMPLAELYRHFVFFYAIASVGFASVEALNGNAKKAPVRPYGPFIAQLTNHRPSCYRDPISGAYRWDTLTALSLFHYILGDTNILPVLSLMLCCRGLEHADFNTNALTTLSMKRIVEVLRRHPSIRTLDLSGNMFFESAGDEILRLVSSNKSIVGIVIDNNHFTDRLAARIKKQVAANAELLREDPMNFLSPNYSYLRSSTDIPSEVWMAVHERWITLIAAPLDVHPRNVDEHKSEKAMKDAKEQRTSVLNQPASSVVAAPKSLIIPLSAEVPAAVAAPLFAESMRHVQIEVLSRLTQDRIIRGIFRDFAAHQGEHLLEVDLPTLQEIERRGVAPDGSLGMPRYGRSYAKMLVTALNATLGAAAKSSDDRALAWRDTVRLLQGLGEAQYELGCRPWHIMFANRAFMEWLTSVLGPSLMDSITQSCWAQVLALISRAVVSGTPLPNAV